MRRPRCVGSLGVLLVRIRALGVATNLARIHRDRCSIIRLAAIARVARLRSRRTRLDRLHDFPHGLVTVARFTP